jgi:hypothetical protein
MVEARLLGITFESAGAAYDLGAKMSPEFVKSMDRLMGLSRAPQVEEAVRTMGSTLLSQQQVSVERYGQAVIGSMERTMVAGYLAGTPREQMVSQVAQFTPKRYWAERIVRTETASAYNQANMDSIQSFDGAKKKILAIFDNRTALDSIGVHGQVRAVGEKFMDGAGRQYLRPPARPNDRETIVPWFGDWKETDYSRPRPPQEVAEAVEGARPKKYQGSPAEKRVAKQNVAKAQKLVSGTTRRTG